MQCNVGGTDRKLRIAAGILILAAGLYFQRWYGLIGLVPLATGIFKFCPAYSPFGVSTGRRGASL